MGLGSVPPPGAGAMRACDFGVEDAKCKGFRRGNGAAPTRLTHRKGLWGSRSFILVPAPHGGP